MLNHQPQSPLASLPVELRNEIYTLSMTSPDPFLNPYFQPSLQPKHHAIASLGATSLARSCRALNTELDLSVLFRKNTFVFTRVAHVHAFYARLTREQMRWIKGITVDLREAASSCADDEAQVTTANTVGNEWLHYLSCNHYAHPSGVWCSRMTTINSDIPDLRELLVDLTGWQSPFAGSRKSGWRYLQRLLGKIRGLDSIALTGKCLDSRRWNPQPLPWGLGPWFSPAFSMDDTSLLELLGATIRKPKAGEVAVFEWNINNGVTSLGVKIIAADAYRSETEASVGAETPRNGIARWDAFLDFKAGLNPNTSTKA